MKTMPQIDIQRACTAAGIPPDDQISSWARSALQQQPEAGEVTIRLVELAEMQQLNARYRDRDAPTNVLSFPAEKLPEVPDAPLGDIVICAAIIAQEAQAQGKAPSAHWAHMIVHGCLHLLGYDHIEPGEAQQMEGLEREILAELGFPDPYRDA